MSFINKIPVLGFATGAVQIVKGDEDKGLEAIRESTRSTVVMGAGALGIVAGPGGAMAAGIAAGAAWDTGETMCTGNPRGVISNVDKMKTATEKGDFDTYSNEMCKLSFTLMSDGFGGQEVRRRVT